MTAPVVETVAPPVAEVVVETPVVAPVVPVVETPVAPTPPAPTGPLTRREARRGLHEDLHAKMTAVETPVVETPVSDAPVVAPEGLPTDTPSPAPEPVAAAPTPIRIPIPDGHPMRSTLPPGVDAITVGSPHEERAVRAAINSYARRNENEALKAQIQQLQKEKVEREAREAATQKWVGRPEYEQALARYNEIRDAFGEADAQQYWKGVNAEFEHIAKQEYDQRIGQVQQEEVEQAAQAWKQEAWVNASTLPSVIRTLPGYSQWFEGAVASFNAELQLGHYPQAQTAEDLHREFLRFFSARLTSQPEVVGVVKSLGERDAQAKALAAAKAAEEQRRIEKIKQDAIDEYKRQAAATRAQTPPHPLGNLGAVSRDRLPTGPEAAVPAAEDLSPNQLRKALRNASREDFRRRLGG